MSCLCLDLSPPPLQLQQQQSRLMKINHDLRHKISVVEAQGKALIEQKVELEAGAQTRGQEVGALRQEVTRLRERLKGDAPTQDPEQSPPQPPSPAQVPHRKHVCVKSMCEPALPLISLITGLGHAHHC